MASRVFAVDLGAWSVKLAIASPGIRGAMLLSVVERLLPPALTEEESTESRARRALAELVREMKLGHETGYLGVYGDQVFTQVLEFGFKHLRRAELDKAIGGELEGVVPVDLEDMVYTYSELPVQPAVAAPDPVAGVRGRVAPPSEGMRVLTYAMRRERAEALISLGREAGFEVRGVLACGGAAARLVNHVPSLARARAEGAVAVIDIGHERTDVVIVAGGKPVFSRSVGRAGKQVTEAIAKFWKMPFDQAENAKHSDGFIASQQEPATSESWARIHQVLIGELQPFARDLRQTFAACRAKTGFAPTAGIIVGGGARLRGMGSFLSEQLGVPVWRLAQDDLLAIAGPKLGAELGGLPLDSAAMTIGMAYDAAGGRPMFDLRSGSLAVKMDLSFIRAKAVPLGAAALVIAAFAAVNAYTDLYRLRKAEKTLSQRLATESAEVFAGKAKTAEEILEINAPTGGPAGARRSSGLPKMTAYDLLLEMSSKVPPKEKITLDVDHLDIADQKIEITGTVKTSEQVDELYNAFKEIKCFKDIVRGPLDSEGELKKFKFTISSLCM